jgi:hypothetical protein
MDLLSMARSGSGQRPVNALSTAQSAAQSPAEANQRLPRVCHMEFSLSQFENSQKMFASCKIHIFCSVDPKITNDMSLES